MKYNFVEISPAGKVRITRNKLIVGMLNKPSFNQNAYGEFLGTLLRFSGKNIFSRKITILDIEGNKVLGEIRFENWNTKVTIDYLGKSYPGELSGESGKWQVADSELGISFESPGLTQTDTFFEQNDMNPAMVLATLYVRGFYKMNRMMVIGAGVLIASVVIGIYLISS